jgi:serine protease SohB
VRDNRPTLDLATVATGESWYGRRAVDLDLVDELCTSDEYLVRACEDADVVEVKWVAHRKPLDRLVSELTSIIERRWFSGSL